MPRRPPPKPLAAVHPAHALHAGLHHHRNRGREKGQSFGQCMYRVCFVTRCCRKPPTNRHSRTGRDGTPTPTTQNHHHLCCAAPRATDICWLAQRDPAGNTHWTAPMHRVCRSVIVTCQVTIDVRCGLYVRVLYCWRPRCLFAAAKNSPGYWPAGQRAGGRLGNIPGHVSSPGARPSAVSDN